MFSRLSIRARITIGSVLVAAVIFSIAVIGMRAQVVHILSASNVTLAEGDLANYEAEIRANPTGLSDDSGGGELVFVRDPSGEVQVDTLPHPVHEVVEHRVGATEHFTMSVEGTSFVVVGETVATDAGNWSLWAARSEASSELALGGLDSAFVLGTAVLLAGFGVASWLLAAAALRPVERMRRKAEGLSADASADGLPVGPARDEISELATTLNDFLARVRQSTAREKQVISDAAHELRTPLAALKTQLELAHGDFGDAEALSAQVVAAEASVARLSSLATNLLELSRLESDARGTKAGGSSGRDGTRASSAEELVSEVMAGVDRARMLGLAKAADVGFTLDVPASLARFPITPQSFSRLVDNLLANAIAAIASGGRVSVSLSADDDGLVLRVFDDGPGMPEEFLPHAFERFSRPDDSRTSSTGGSGLGLALVGAIASAAGARLSLHNEEAGFLVLVSIPKM